MELAKKKEGLGYLIKWIVRLGDLVVINSTLILLSLFLLPTSSFQTEAVEIGALLLVNVIYFIVASIIPIHITSNIIYFDKIIHRSFTFISSYYILLTSSMVLLNFNKIGWSNWAAFYLVLSLSYIVWHIAVRLVLKWYRSRGYNYKRVVIIGDNQKVKDVYDELKSNDYGYKILGFFSDIQNTREYDINYLGKTSEIYEVEKYCLENKVDEIYCTLPNTEESTILHLINFSEKNVIRFYLVPQFYNYINRRLTLRSLQSIPIISIRPEPLQLTSNRLLKRAFDVVFSSIILISIFPIIYVIFGIIIRLTSKGSIIFKQQRTGFKGKEFTCYKFRTMYENEYADSSPTQRFDSRITSIGKFMRRTSIDELPQFFNVLLGNMSVTGPRPLMVKETDFYNGLIDIFMIRHIIKPGISGWAQITGYRGEMKSISQMEKRFKQDVWYIENWSFILDIKIIVVTIYQILRGDKNVY